MADRAGYYDYPVVRKPVWTWEVPVYFWLGGMAGGAYLTASAAELFGDDDDRRATGAGFYVAAAAVLPCAPLLIADLGRPERFHHMLRIFKPLSPMNLGAWTLAGFTPMTVARAMAQADDRLPALMSSLLKLVPNRLVELVGAVFGMVLAGYTGVLLAATNVPLWAKSRLLPAVFTASAVASGSAAVSLAAEPRAADRTLRKLDVIENAGGLAELGLAHAAVARAGRAGPPRKHGPNAMPFWGGAIGLGGVLPILLRLAGRGGSPRTRRRLGTLAAACSIIGSLALRWSVFEAGKESSQDQQASMEFSRA